MQRIRKSFLALAATASLLLGASIAVTPASATEVQFNFTGIVLIDPIGPFYGGFFNNANGSFKFDDAAATGGSYPDVVKDFSMTFLNNSYSASFDTGGANTIKIFNDIPNGFGDTVDRWNLRTDVVTSSSPVSGYSANRADFTFDRLVPAHEFADGTNMQNPPSIESATSAPEINRLRVYFENVGGNVLVVQVAVTNLTAAVPLPPAVILFGAGLVALIGLGARNWQLKGNRLA